MALIHLDRMAAQEQVLNVKKKDISILFQNLLFRLRKKLTFKV